MPSSRASDLPGHWHRFKAGPASTTDLCGRPRAPQQRTLDRESIAWAISPENGPIFGERLDQYSNPAAAAKGVEHDTNLTLPGEFTRSDGTRWRTERLRAPGVGHHGQVFLVTSRDRRDSFNYEVAARSGDTVLRVALNSRRSDRRLLERLVGIAWTRAAASGLPWTRRV